ALTSPKIRRPPVWGLRAWRTVAPREVCRKAVLPEKWCISLLPPSAGRWISRSPMPNERRLDHEPEPGEMGVHAHRIVDGHRRHRLPGQLAYAGADRSAAEGGFRGLRGEPAF